MSRRPIWILVGLSLLMSACSVQDALPLPDCRLGGSGWIVAQSVPGADLVPCLNELPRGWEAASVTVNEKGTEIRFDSDRAGTSAAHLYYRKACDLGPAVSIPSDQEEADAFENVRQIVPSFHGSRYYVFPGGCVWWDFEFDGGVSATRSVELGDSLELVGRDILNGRIRRTFVDAEL